jgi:signal transduction histidine kinase
MEETAAYLVFIVVISAGVVLFLAFITVDIFMLLRYRQLKMQSEMLEIKTNFTRELSTAREEAAEHVMNEISRELHDNILQQLTLGTLQLNQTARMHPDIAVDVQATVELIRETSSNLRELSHMLSGDLYNKLQLGITVERLKESIERTGIISADFVLYDFPETLEKSRELFILRILQEMVNNSMKYARATVLTFRLIPHKEFIQFVYKDNGKGFNRQKINPGLGLINIEKRLDLMKANWFLDSTEGNGIHFNAEIPYTE